jgi:hypothetical protein
MVILRGHIGLPIGEGYIRGGSLRLIEDAPAGGVHDVVVGIDEAGVDCPTACVENALRAPGTSELRRWTDGDNPAIGIGDGASFENAPLPVDGHHVAIPYAGMVKPHLSFV